MSAVPKDWRKLIDPADPDDVFELTEILASGAYGSVYKVRAAERAGDARGGQKQEKNENNLLTARWQGVALADGRELAVKIIAVDEEAALKDMLSEVTVFRRASPHRNLVQFEGAFEKEDELYIAMEFCAGGCARPPTGRSRVLLSAVLFSSFCSFGVALSPAARRSRVAPARWRV